MLSVPLTTQPWGLLHKGVTQFALQHHSRRIRSLVSRLLYSPQRDGASRSKITSRTSRSVTTTSTLVPKASRRALCHVHMHGNWSARVTPTTGGNRGWDRIKRVWWNLETRGRVERWNALYSLQQFLVSWISHRFHTRLCDLSLISDKYVIPRKGFLFVHVV